MFTEIQYDSEHYQPILWRSILESAFCALHPNVHAIGVLCVNHLFLTLDNISRDQEIMIFSDASCFSVKTKNCIMISCVELNHQKIYLYQCHETHSDTTGSKKFVISVIKNSYLSIQHVFVYVYEHLKNRTFNHHPLAQKEVIRLKFSKLLIYFSEIEALFSDNMNIAEMNVALSILVDLSDQLAKLSGARAILCGNITELQFHLMLFRKLFFSEY